MGMRFHYLAMPHVPVSSKYPACAFTAKIHKLCRMLKAKGHTVFLYGAGYTDTDCDEFVQLCTTEEIAKQYGDGDNNFELGYDISKGFGFRHDINQTATALTQKFNKKAIEEINKRKLKDDFLLLPQGYYQKAVADKVNLWLTCEPGIGYRGSYARFRAFESSFIMNYTYGSQNPYADQNGNHYDRVIPNYFDPSEFTFQPKAQNYLMFMGRLIERKGYEIAFRTAKELGIHLVIAGAGDWENLNKFDNKDCEYLGLLNQAQRNKWLGGAKAFFAPTLYLEPFGGVAVEAMMTGTPAITTNFGAFTDTVNYGVSGYRCDTLKDFVHNTEASFYLDRLGVYEWSLRYTMDYVNMLYEKWWQDLYQLYLSAHYPESELGWSKL
jgi:glycosyltransferase involved in cell wall biosynthesis